MVTEEGRKQKREWYLKNRDFLRRYEQTSVYKNHRNARLKKLYDTDPLSKELRRQRTIRAVLRRKLKQSLKISEDIKKEQQVNRWETRNKL